MTDASRSSRLDPAPTRSEDSDAKDCGAGLPRLAGRPGSGSRRGAGLRRDVEHAGGTRSGAAGARTITGPRDFLRGYQAIVAPGTVHAVVEVPAGYVDKWAVKSADGWLHWDIKDGKPRRVKVLGSPCNYGMVPRTVRSKF
ncbi:MAG: hypothetical protein NTZ61_10285 [Proteobacteria bacterium]|nr:hypothetical protein [Pseudomonadota bacterium]